MFKHTLTLLTTITYNYFTLNLTAVTKLYEFWVDTYYEGPLLKFEYKTGQDPTKVAQLFIDNNGLQQSSLRKIVNHLLENIPEENQYNNIGEYFLIKQRMWFSLLVLLLV